MKDEALEDEEDGHSYKPGEESEEMVEDDEE